MNYEVYRVAWVSDRYLDEVRKYNEQFSIKRVTDPNKQQWTLDDFKIKRPKLPEEITRSDLRWNPIKTTQINNFISFEWDDDKDKISTSFSYVTSEELNCGDWICLYNAKDDVDVLFGVITNKSRSDLYKYTYTGYDIGFYFGKNDITIQFRDNQTISNAIKEVCHRVEVQPGHIEELKEPIKEIYRNKAASDVLKDIYKNILSSNYIDSYYFDCKNGKLNFDRFRETSEELKGYINYIAKHGFFDYIKDFTISSSMEDLKNRVQLFVKDSPNNKENLPDFIEPANESISKYGLLNHIEEVDKGKSEKYYNEISENLLIALNNESESISFSILGDYKLRKGLVVRINNRKLNLHSQYDVLSSNHKIDATSELVKLTIRQSLI